ncbi:EexN family lipoprotein [Pseudomonas veronii]|nr:EexN family lipoprotein [Pseudomonas veronii]
MFLMIALALVACGKSRSVDTVESLVAQPNHLREVERQCESDDTRSSLAECNAAFEARRRLFLGNGPQYTPSKNSPKF